MKKRKLVILSYNPIDKRIFKGNNKATCTLHPHTSVLIKTPQRMFTNSHCFNNFPEKQENM